MKKSLVDRNFLSFRTLALGQKAFESGASVHQQEVQSLPPKPLSRAAAPQPGAFLFAAVAMVLFFLQGCAPLIVGAGLGAGAIVGGAASEERGMGGALTDTEIRTRINLSWYQYNRTMHGKLTLTVREGRALVAGTLSDEQEHLEAIKLTWQAKGVKEVIDQIKVTGSEETLGEVARDSWITTKLKSKLVFDGYVASRNYTIVTVGGVVYVMGVAQNQEELNRVTDHARHITGVVKVVSYVRLKDEPQG